MTEIKNAKNTTFRWFWPEFSLTIPGDFALGILLAVQATPASNFTQTGLAAAISAGILMAISIFCVYKANSVNSRLLPYAIGLYRLLAVSFCSAIVYKKGIPPQAIIAGLALLVYSAAALRVGMERFNEPTRKLGFAAWWPSVLTVVLGLVCITRNLTIYGMAAPTLVSIYMGAWIFLRTIYVSNAIKGWCTPERLFQASGLLIRGTIPVQAIIFMTFPTENPWNIVAAAFAGICVSTLQTLACKIFPTPEN